MSLVFSVLNREHYFIWKVFHQNVRHCNILSKTRLDKNAKIFLMQNNINILKFIKMCYLFEKITDSPANGASLVNNVVQKICF